MKAHLLFTFAIALSAAGLLSLSASAGEVENGPVVADEPEAPQPAVRRCRDVEPGERCRNAAGDILIKPSATRERGSTTTQEIRVGDQLPSGVRSPTGGTAPEPTYMDLDEADEDSLNCDDAPPAAERGVGEWMGCPTETGPEEGGGDGGTETGTETTGGGDEIQTSEQPD